MAATKNKPETISFFIHESDMARITKANEALKEENRGLRDTIETLLILYFITVIAFFVGFFLYESQFETVSEERSTTEMSGAVTQNTSEGSTSNINIAGGDAQNVNN